jgi:hypothetical protein
MMESTSPPNTGGVRRHHTITAASRSARASALSEEEQQQRQQQQQQQQQQQSWHEDEVVDQGWVGGVGAVGEKSGLHRQASLPTKYNRAFHGGGKSGTMTPGLNSLSAIAGHEGDEEDWERDISSYGQGPESGDQSGDPSPLSPHIGGPASHVPSPPPAESGVRRHQSLTYGTHGHGPRHQLSSTGLKRSGTLQAPSKHSITPQPPSPTNAEEDYPYPDEEPYEEDAYYSAAASPRTQHPPGNVPYSNSPMRRSSPWGQGNEWRSAAKHPGAAASGNAIDDVQRALSALELDNNAGQQYMYGNQESHQPPRFNTGQHNYIQSGGNPQLATDLDDRHNTQGGSQSPFPQHSQHQRSHTHTPGVIDRDERSQSVSGPNWEHKERMLGGRYSNPNMNYGYQQAPGAIPNVPPIPAQYLSQQPGMNQAPRLGTSNSDSGQNQNTNQSGSLGLTPIDVPSLIALKGYNPQNFDIRPQFARYFVIKSYTEDDVHKSLKYEIWSSTDPGNKRLDKAFKETTGRGPIYLFFSVNASGHFCGMAEMLTPVDYTRSSTVWASDKWKGVFKVRWIFVRDIPNANLRHIKLNNTQERKPVTNSRDTQELLPDAGQEMLRIFHIHPARTSLLQDFAFYELQSLQKMQAQQSASPPLRSTPTSSPPPQSMSPVNNAQPGNFAMSNPNALAYTVPQMTPLMQMQLHMNMNPVASQYGMPPNQAMHQSVMRDHHSNQGNNQSNYNGSSGF